MLPEFLETYPLYKTFRFDLANAYVGDVHFPNLNFTCKICKSIQTFIIYADFARNYGVTQTSVKITGRIIHPTYVCVNCRVEERFFAILVNKNGTSVEKIGQWPPWSIVGDKNIEGMLSDPHSEYYKRGLICESQGYGVGAFAYYRRIVEEIIDALLGDVATLLVDNDLDVYKSALDRVNNTRVASEKIEIVKELLPPLLRPDGMNPLAALHSALSEGLHAESDEECLKYSASIRTILIYLTTQIKASQAAGKAFTLEMHALLGKKQGKRSATHGEESK